ncbi:MAG: tRNA pseudouridine(55) synthase TruB [Candidatus Dadabacteria bacterium]|nr:tRNA pseudouridine(55) synthase TruB [Candidatus Dadabacteria bacterium]MYA48260.1 tRNA pseudouridine(55) synthase TruB [Candidatus Dadabacteria bacterium]MYF48164.1 tRNA pseudouridine(55) synthase TruB [Candidatus Dadabacteria bacterium]MYG82240.1 tRNA pseudouridine(55) synthase TruB [Candidatus Dadabacteria bacterium]MYK49837.1 tRNA pseudouridine(55) synthase TruB [Candidatus Dadabacteria bacterium]
MDGVMILDKPRGCTSAQVLNRVKKAVGAKKAGHTGTLDPFATGVLPVCFDQATKAIPYLGDDIKEYEAEMTLGVSTDTMDDTGTVTGQVSAEHIGRNEVEEVIKGFSGEIMQIPPMYSAAKVSGTKLYALARAGKEIEREPKRVTIEKIRLLHFSYPKATFYVRCSRGTYVRVIASDAGRKLGCGAHLSELRRLRSGPFALSDANSIEDVESGNYNILPLDEVLAGYPRVYLEGSLCESVRNGIPLSREALSGVELPEFKNRDIITVFCRKTILSICEAKTDSDEFEYMGDKDIVFRHLRVFN